MSKWMQVIQDMAFNEDQNLDEMTRDSTKAKDHDIGFVNAKSGAGILARDSGVLEGYADHNLGFRFDPKTKTLMLIAPTIKMFCQDFNVYKPEDAPKFERLTKEHEEILGLLGGEVDEEV